MLPIENAVVTCPPMDVAHAQDGAYTGMHLCSWQDRAIGAFQHAKTDTDTQLRSELVRRLSVLTGRKISAERVYADPHRHTARITVDGVSFRLIADELVVLAPCAYCGVREFESPPVRYPADLGYALSEWKPYCRDCAPEDPNNW